MTLIDRMVLCTGNAGKIVEMKALLPRPMVLLSLKDIDLQLDLPETGRTLYVNALQKARYAYERCGLPCVADDTGLEVDALDGAPGVYSARYAGEAKDPLANMAKVLGGLEGREDRTARFRTVIALVSTEGERTFDGTVEGVITRSPRGSGGFGYDPIFQPDGHAGTFAEMDASVKNTISHRAKAMRQLVDHLAELARR